MEKYTVEVSATKIVERIKHLLGQGVQIPLKKTWVITGFGGTLWVTRESDAIDFGAGFDYLHRCRAIKVIDAETFELGPYFETLTPPKYPAPPPFPIQIDRQIRNEAENMQHCYYWLYIFENTLRNFIGDSLSAKYENWYDALSEKVKKNIERNKKKWPRGIPPRSPLEFTELSILHTTIEKEWDNVFKAKFEGISQASLKESLDRIEEFRSTIAHNRMLAEEESKAFYNEIKRVLSSIKLFSE